MPWYNRAHLSSGAAATMSRTRAIRQAPYLSSEALHEAGTTRNRLRSPTPPPDIRVSAEHMTCRRTQDQRAGLALMKRPIYTEAIE